MSCSRSNTPTELENIHIPNFSFFYIESGWFPLISNIAVVCVSQTKKGEFWITTLQTGTKKENEEVIK